MGLIRVAMRRYGEEGGQVQIESTVNAAQRGSRRALWQGRSDGAGWASLPTLDIARSEAPNETEEAVGHDIQHDTCIKSLEYVLVDVELLGGAERRIRERAFSVTFHPYTSTISYTWHGTMAFKVGICHHR